MHVSMFLIKFLTIWTVVLVIPTSISCSDSFRPLTNAHRYSPNAPKLTMNNFGVSRGAWTEEEDMLLKECIDNYGVGKWHQVPARSGLNRCRKSCRLRWLNYLQPNIKRGAFGDDEVDLILKLHKLLGNRWSLIAGRLPGRTANDVKNYWNTHLKKKLLHVIDDKDCHKDQDSKMTQQSNKVTVVKPRAWSFSNTSLASLQKQLSVKLNNLNCDDEKEDKGDKNVTNEINYYFSEEAESMSSWWEGCWFTEKNAARSEDEMPPPATIIECAEESWPDLGLWELLSITYQQLPFR